MTTKIKINHRLLSLLLAIVMLVGLIPGVAVTASATTITPVKPYGEGTETNPYKIGTAGELYWYATNVNSNANIAVRSSYAELTADITVNSSVLKTDGTLSENASSFVTWTAIGNGYSTAYTGHFDGKGYTIRGLYLEMDPKTSNYVGFIGHAGDGAVVKNVTVEDSYFSGMSGIGGIIGQTARKSTVTVENCHNGATVVSHTIGNGGYAGGIIGHVSSTANLKDCTNHGVICVNTDYASTKNETSRAGGIVGTGSTLTFENCHNSGSVTGVSWVGGVVGYAGTPVKITECSNTGAITGNALEGLTSSGKYVGGIIGAANGVNTCEVKDCYNAGSVQATNQAGGIVGSWVNNDKKKIENCHNYGEMKATTINPFAPSSKKCSNSYYLDTITSKTEDAAKSAEEFANDTVVDLLNAGRTGTDAVWVQGEKYPVFKHTHSWKYALDGTDTIKATCTAFGCANTDGGSITLNAANAYYTASGIVATATGSLSTGATYTITYDSGVTSAPSDIGNHTATLTVSENETAVATVTVGYTISYLPAPEVPYSISNGYKDDNGIYWFKDGDTITVAAPGGYTIAKTLGGDYEVSLSFSESADKVIYLKNTNGEMTDKVNVTETFSFDKTAPTGKIEITGRGFWQKLLNKISFGLFFKGETIATVITDDADSGVKTVEYYLADSDLINNVELSDTDVIQKLETAVNGNWSTYSNEISLNQNAKNVIYVKITDNVGNVTYINSEGIVLYTDAQADTESVTTVYKAGIDKEVKVKLNGNTIQSVSNGMKVLAKGVDYTIDGDKITLKADYLDTLNVDDYTFTASYNPLGLEYTENDKNDMPSTTTFTLYIEKTAGSVTTISDVSKTYDGNAVSNPNYTSLNTGNATYEYKVKGADDSTYTTTAPKSAGVYTVRVTVAADETYKEASATADFTISTKKITVTIAGKTSIYGDEIKTLTATDNGIVNGDENVYRLSTTASKTASIGTYDITGTALDNNYSITFTGGKNAYEITKRNLTVTVVVNDKQYDGRNTASIKSVTLNNVANNDSITLVNGTPTFDSVNVANGIGITFTDFTLNGDADVLKNYTLKQPTGVTANITNGWNPVKDTEYTASTPNENGWLKEDMTVTAKDGYELSLTNTADGTWVNTFIGAVESADSSLKFYVRNKTTGAISEQVTVAYKLDKNTETTGTTGKVEFVGRKSWQTFVNTITFGLFYKDEVTVKVEATDKLSGVASIEYAVSDKEMSLEEVKAITDWTAMPEDGVGVTVEDEKTFVYFIRITDKAGNVTYLSTDGAEYDTTLPAIDGVENGATYHTTQVITVTDKNLESVTLNDEPVTFDGEGKLTLNGNLDTTYAIKATDKAGNVTEYTVTMKTIADIKDSIKDITVDDVTSDDRETIETVIKDIEEELKNDDLTDEEKAELEDEKQKAEDLIKKIEEANDSSKTDNTDKVKDITSDNVETKDKADLKKAKDDLEKALEDYKDNLTDDEKKDIQDEIERIEDALEVIEKVENVENLINKLPDTITKGDADAIKKADEAYNALSKYEQSILDKNAKKKLDNAKSALEALNKTANSPATGDNGNLWMWFALLFVSGGGLLGTTVYRRKRKETEN